jgi:putative membrane protein
MKSILRSIIFNAAAIWFVSMIISGIVLERGYETLFISAFALGMINLLIKPIINILLLPINLLTLGTLRWIVNVIALYLVTVLVSDFKILPVKFSGLTYSGIVIPAFSLNLILSFIFISFLISLISGFLFWLTK